MLDMMVLLDVCGAGCSSDAKSGAAKAVKTLEDLSVMLECDGDRVAHKVSLSRFCAYNVSTARLECKCII